MTPEEAQAAIITLRYFGEQQEKGVFNPLGAAEDRLDEISFSNLKQKKNNKKTTLEFFKKV